MSVLSSTRTRVASVAAAAFAGGLLLASGLHWTGDSQAEPLLQRAAAPSRSAVQPVADLSQAFISIAEAVTPSVVSIQAERAPRRSTRAGNNIPPEFRDFFGMPDRESAGPQEVSGSGFIITADGYVVTNNHVVEDATRLSIVLQDNRNLTGRVVGRDPNTDIAVVKVEATGLPAVRLGNSESARIGEWVLAIGNPLDLGTTVTSGIISAKGRGLRGLLAANRKDANWTIEDFIQTDAPINPGNSGGPLVNLRGEVVGVNSAIASPTGFYSGYGFAVPIDLARRIADDLIRFGRVRRPALGVQVTEVGPEDAEVYKLTRIQGVVVQDFPAQSAGRAAGLKQGDVIVAVEGHVVEHVGQFQRLIATRRPGEQVVLDVIRYGAARKVKVALGEAPGGQAVSEKRGGPEPVADVGNGRLGISVTPMTAALAQELGYREARGLAVAEVVPYGAGFRGGLRKGLRITSVDGRAVNAPEEFRAALTRKAARSVVSLGVDYPEGQRAIVNIRLGSE